MGSAVLSQTIPAVKVSRLFIYPIKSCRGISVSYAPLTPAGNLSLFVLFYRKMLIVSLVFLLGKGIKFATFSPLLTIQPTLYLGLVLLLIFIILCDRTSMGSRMGGGEFPREGMHSKS